MGLPSAAAEDEEVIVAGLAPHIPLEEGMYCNLFLLSITLPRFNNADYLR